MCLKTPKVSAPPPPPPPAPPPAAPADIEFGKGKSAKTQDSGQKTRKKLRTDLKNPGVSMPGASARSGLNITRTG